MNARVITVQWKMDQLEEAMAFFRNEVATALKTQPGFANTRFLVDRATGKGTKCPGQRANEWWLLAGVACQGVAVFPTKGDRT